MCGQVAVSLFISCIFRYKVQVFSSDDDRSVHFRGNDGASEDSAPNGHHTSERTLLVYNLKSARVSFASGRLVGHFASRLIVCLLVLTYRCMIPQSRFWVF